MRVSLGRLAEAVRDRSWIWARGARVAARTAVRKSIGDSLAAIVVVSGGSRWVTGRRLEGVEEGRGRAGQLEGGRLSVAIFSTFARVQLRLFRRCRVV